MKAGLFISIFLAALVSNVVCSHTWRIKRKKCSVFDIIPLARNIPTRNSAFKDLQKNDAGALCECKNSAGLCVLDTILRCRRVVHIGGERRKRGRSRHRRRRHQRKQRIKRQYQKWLKQSSNE